MNGAAWLLALATLGVDYGWRLDSKGQLEYIIQIPPSQLESVRDSPEGISSAIPPEVVRHVKKFRIVVGTEPLPRDPLPAFSADGSTNLGVTPIGAGRVTPASGDFPSLGDPAAGFSPSLQSTVTPLDNLNAPRDALPGPGHDYLGDANDAVGETLPIPPIPRADHIRDIPSRIPNVDPLAASGSRPPPVRRDTTTSAGGFPPNTNAPDTADAWGLANRAAGYTDLGNTGSSVARTLPRRDLTNAWGGTPYVADKDPPYAALLLTVCALCLSIGGNVYLGWIAWGYYMKYRESFESWRNSWSTPA